MAEAETVPLQTGIATLIVDNFVKNTIAHWHKCHAAYRFCMHSFESTYNTTEMEAKTNALNWFEVSATDLNRAKNFYEQVLDIKMEVQEMNGTQMAYFPQDGSSGAIAVGPNNTPSATGSRIYFNGNPDLNHALGRVEAAGGKVLMPKTQIGNAGHIAIFLDTEGNNVALHSNN